MKTLITVTPNRERGYDATVYSVRKVHNSAFLRNLTGQTSGEEREPLQTVNAPSEERARLAAQAWLDSQPKPTRTRRAMSDRDYEGHCESQEAARNEERAYGCD